ncbi:MAG: phage head-tail connector protein [Clostridia bacterium]|nr:phage head-tail connector protein [Clostridia bacterium]
MAATTLLDKIKQMLSITTNYQDAMLQLYIDDVKAFMKDAGVPVGVIESDAAVGCIARGVSDLWNYGAGTAKLSEYFKQRVIQLAGGSDGQA